MKTKKVMLMLCAILATGALAGCAGLGQNNSTGGDSSSSYNSSNSSSSDSSEVNVYPILNVYANATQIMVGQTFKLDPFVTYNGEEVEASFTYESADTTIATVAEDGTVTAVAAGKVKISVLSTYDGVNLKESIEITVIGGYSFSIAQDTAELKPDADLTLNYYAYHNTESVENPTVEWESSDETVVTVENGKLTAVGFGSATVTATYEGISDSVTVRVTATGDSKTDPYTYYAISTAEELLAIESTMDKAESYYYLTQDIDMNEVGVFDGFGNGSGTGSVTAVFGGVLDGMGYAIKNCHFTNATSNRMIALFAKVTGTIKDIAIFADVDSANFDNIEKPLTFGMVYWLAKTGVIDNCYMQLKANRGGNNGGECALAIVSDCYGSISNCICVIDLTDADTYANVTTVAGNVRADGSCVNSYGVLLTKKDVTVVPTIIAAGSSGDGCAAYSSSAALIEEEAADITAEKGWHSVWSVTDGKLYFGRSVIAKYMPLLSVSASATTVKKGDVVTLSKTVTYKGEEVDAAFVYTSSNDSIATVNDNGEVTAIAAGTVKINVSATYNGETVQGEVTITVADEYMIAFESEMQNIAIDNSAELKYTAYKNATPVENPSVAWTSSDTNIVTVENGKISAKGYGTATVTATYEGATATISIKVTITGTAEDKYTYYKVSTAEEFLAMESNMAKADVCYYLTQDIDMSSVGVFAGFGLADNGEFNKEIRFYLDGRGYAVKNIQFKNAVNNRFVALFGRCWDATIKNIALYAEVKEENLTLSTTPLTISMFRFLRGSTVVENCYFYLKSDIVKEDGEQSLSIVSNFHSGTLKNCICAVDVTAFGAAEIQHATTIFGHNQNGSAVNTYGVLIAAEGATATATTNSTGAIGNGCAAVLGASGLFNHVANMTKENGWNLSVWRMNENATTLYFGDESIAVKAE